MVKSKLRNIALFILLFSCVSANVLTPTRSEATSVVLPVDFYILGDPNIQSLLPLGFVTIADIGANQVQFDVSLTPGVVKFVNLGLMLSPVIDQSQFILTSLSGDQMSLDTGGWLSYYPIKVEFNDKPTHPVSFTLSAPGLDVTDFFYVPPHLKYGGSIFALNLWYLQIGDMIDSTVGSSTTTVPGGVVPEPITSLLLGTGVCGLIARRRRSSN